MLTAVATIQRADGSVRTVIANVQQVNESSAPADIVYRVHLRAPDPDSPVVEPLGPGDRLRLSLDT